MKLARVILIMMVSVGSARRVKRLLFGDIITTFGNDVRPERYSSTYDALYYTVSMKPGWEKMVQATEWNDLYTSWEAQVRGQTKYKLDNDYYRARALKRPTNNRCGGSFLTPTIVQTACHCVAHFFGEGSANKLVWEEPLVIYSSLLGFSRKGVAQGPGIYSARRYYAHKFCALWSTGMTRIIKYDYGLITLAKGDWGKNDAPAVFPRGNSAGYNLYTDYIRNAPLYTSQDLDKNYLNIMRRQAICLFLGNGYSSLDNSSGVMSVYRPGAHDVWEDNGLPRHTWRSITGYRFCYDFIESLPILAKAVQIRGDPNSALRGTRIVWHGPEIEMKEPIPGEDETDHQTSFTQQASFTCSMNAGKFQAVPVAGDGGYPVTCNNVYFAIQGMGWTKWNPSDRMSLQSAIVYSKFENAAEFRDDLLIKLARWDGFSKQNKGRRRKMLHFKERSNWKNIPLNSGPEARDFPTFLLLAVPFTSKLIKTSA